MRTHVEDPAGYFKTYDFFESPVLDFAFQSGDQSARLVIDYAGVCRPPGGEYHREFHELHFTGVRKMELLTSKRRKISCLRWHGPDLRLDREGHFDVEEVSVRRLPSVYAIRLSLGEAGTVSFECDRVMADRRRGRAKRTGEKSWQYFDAETGEPFDFHHPFG